MGKFALPLFITINFATVVFVSIQWYSTNKNFNTACDLANKACEMGINTIHERDSLQLIVDSLQTKRP